MERIVIPIFSAKDGEGNNIFEDNYEVMRLSCIYAKDDTKDNIIKAIYDIKKELNDCDIVVYKDTAYIYNETGDFIDTLDVYENIPKIVKSQLELNTILQ